jgi:hypothetical protein
MADSTAALASGFPQLSASLPWTAMGAHSQNPLVFPA